MSRVSLYFFICLIVIITGCETYSQNDYQEYYVIESYLVANRNLPEVLVSHTMPIEEKYSFQDAAISDADVEIRLLEGDGTVEKTYPYHLSGPGTYSVINPAKVLPEREYKLYITFPGSNDTVSAHTLVPGDFHAVDSSLVDTATYQSQQQIEITTTRSTYPGRQSFFIFTVNAIDPAEEKLTPFYNDQADNEDAKISDFYVNSSGIINEENYDENKDGTLTLRLPWIAVAFYGENDVTANAIDDNMYDFLRSQDVQGGGSTLPPGEIQNIIYHVDGGIGVFGSLASDTSRVYIKRKSN